MESGTLLPRQGVAVGTVGFEIRYVGVEGSLIFCDVGSDADYALRILPFWVAR